MTMMRLVFAAKKAAAVQTCAVDIFDPSSSHEVQEFGGVGVPTALAFPVLIQNFLRRRQLRLFVIFYVADLLGKIAQVVSLGETGKLRNIVQTHIDQFLNMR